MKRKPIASASKAARKAEQAAERIRRYVEMNRGAPTAVVIVKQSSANRTTEAALERSVQEAIRALGEFLERSK